MEIYVVGDETIKKVLENHKSKFTLIYGGMIGVNEVLKLQDADYIVSPGNSYGRLTGGFDKVIGETFKNAETSLRHEIIGKHFGELPIGSVVKVPIRFKGEDGVKEPTLVYPAVMRIPSKIPHGNDLLYTCYKNALVSMGADVLHRNNIKCVIPLFGTGSGRVNPYTSLCQLELALDILTNPNYNLGSWNHGHQLIGKIKATW